LALATYSDLQAAVASWLRRGDLADQIPSFIALAEAQMNRRLRVRPMTVRLSQTWSTEYADLPGDFLAEREVKILGAGAARALTYLTPDQVDARALSSAQGRPRFYALYGNQLRLNPAPDVGYEGELLYLAAIPSLSDVNPTNWLLQAHPDAYLYGALTQSAPYLRADDRLQTWGTLFTTILGDIEVADRRGSAARLRGEAAARRRPPFDFMQG
jgi:hypothetical protein